MRSKKIRRDSGRESGSSTLLKELKKKDIINNCLEPQEYWNDWNDYRDGQRNWHSDLTKKRNYMVIKGYLKYCGCERCKLIYNKYFTIKRKERLKEG